MKNLKQLCLFLSVGSIATLSIGACSDDPATSPGAAGTAAGGTAPTAGTPAGGTAPTAGTPAGGTAPTAGTPAGGTAPTAGTASGGSGGASGGSGGASGGSGGKAGSGGTGGTGGASGGSGGASGGSGGSGGGASAGCMKICMGADSIGTICAGEPMSDRIKNTCLASCAKATSMQVQCWNTHAANAKNTPADKVLHCTHAAGASPCNEWPAP